MPGGPAAPRSATPPAGRATSSRRKFPWSSPRAVTKPTRHSGAGSLLTDRWKPEVGAALLRQGRPLVEAGGVTDEVTADARRVRVVLDLAACVAMRTRLILKSSAPSASS